MKSIFITGAGSGMGLATAELFIEKGWQVAAVDRNIDALRELEARAEGRLFVRRLDVTDVEDFRAAMAEFGAISGGKLDILFNNAGIGGQFGSYEALTHAEIMALVNVNLVGVLNGIHVGIPLLKQASNPLCISTASSVVTFGQAGAAVYSAAKSGVKSLTEALSVEFEVWGGRCAAIIPGMTDTPLVPNAVRTAAASRGMMAPSVIAETVWKAYHANDLHYYLPPTLQDEQRATANNPASVRKLHVERGSYGAFIKAGDEVRGH